MTKWIFASGGLAQLSVARDVLKRFGRHSLEVPSSVGFSPPGIPNEPRTLEMEMEAWLRVASSQHEPREPMVLFASRDELLVKRNDVISSLEVSFDDVFQHAGWRDAATPHERRAEWRCAVAMGALQPSGETRIHTATSVVYGTMRQFCPPVLERYPETATGFWDPFTQALWSLQFHILGY